MNNRATGMIFLMLFTILLLAFTYGHPTFRDDDLIALFAFVFLIAGIFYLIGRDQLPPV